ncbi:ATP-binding protein [Mesorhizobium sp.]|uniref:ATP-binding protein n=1 Tax=Mesorhizobium sp. TaxID=1871066 RepID=UPI002600A936|nr:ATP-binding protein [Mesorhizobium sp.]
MDRAAVEDLMTLSFMNDAANIVFIGPNGVGKSTLARNVAHQALICGHTVLFRTASEMLGELAALDSDAALRRRLHHYAAADVLAIDSCAVLRDVESPGCKPCFAQRAARATQHK